MKINIVIPNYNGAALVEKNLSFVVASLKSYHDSVVTIIDDGSQDQDFKRLSAFIESFRNDTAVPLTLLRHERNRGFSSTVNKGVYSTESDYVVLLNSDVAPEPDFLASSLNILKHDTSVFGVGSMDKSIENGKTILRGRGVGSFHHGFLMHRRGRVDKTNTLWISGGSSIIRTELFKKLGGFDETYDPFYWEDIDLSYRALKSGYSLVFNPESIVEHHHEEGAIKQNFTSNKISSTAYRNQFMFVWKNITDSSYIIEHLLYLPIHLGKALLRGDFDLIRGFFLALQLSPRVVHHRFVAQKQFKLSDHQILSWF